MNPFSGILPKQSIYTNNPEIDRQTTIKENARRTLDSLEEAAIDSLFFKSETMVSLTDDVAKINPGYSLTAKSNDYFVEMADLDEVTGQIKQFKKRELQSSSGGASRFRENDILFARITPCTENGKVALVSGLGEETGTGSTEFVVISPHTDKVNPRWLYFFLKNFEVRYNAKVNDWNNRKTESTNEVFQ